MHSNTRRPEAVAAALDARRVARAYNYPTDRFTGAGFTCGIVELGGGFGPADLRTYFGTSVPSVVAVAVGSGRNAPDGPNGADGEVLLDIEVAAAVAPGADFRVYFAENTDQGFLEAVERAVAECDVVSISWGGPESSWDAATVDEFDQAFAAARRAGVVVFVAAGDTGSDDGTGTPTVDFPASSPNVIACGGTRLEVNADGSRASEVTWDDDDASSATGGGVSRHFPGRQVPDVAGNADPATGYSVVVDGHRLVIGGTSAVAPLYAGLALLLSQALGVRVGSRVDLMNTLLTNLGVCFDVTVGDNGAYRAGPGRDRTTGLGVVDGGKLLAVLTDTLTDPAPVPAPPLSPPDDAKGAREFAAADLELLDAWSSHKGWLRWASTTAAKAAWRRGETVAAAIVTAASASGTGSTHFRDAGTGRFVSEEFADHNRSTTVREQG